MAKWNGKEIDLLIKNYGKLSIKKLVCNLNHNKNSIRHKASRLNLTECNHWTNEEIGFLKNNYPNMDKDLLKLNLDHHTWEGIKRKAHLIGLKRKFKFGISIDENFFKKWNPEMAYIFGFWIADGNMYEKTNQ